MAANFATYLPQRASHTGFDRVSARPDPVQQDRPLVCVVAGQGPFFVIRAEGVGFEPTMSVTTHNGFQDRRHRPLGEPSWLRRAGQGRRFAAPSLPSPAQGSTAASATATMAAMPIDPDRPFRGCAEFYADRRHRISPVFARLIAARLGLTGEQRVLDLGCGPAILAELFAPYAAEVVAADPEPDMLAEGRRRCSAAGVTNVTFVRASSHRLDPVSSGTPFSAVTIGQAFHWMRPQDEALLALDRIVDDTGAVVLIHPGLATDHAAWKGEIAALVDEFVADVPNGDHPSGRHDPFDEILRRSPFSRLEELTFDYDAVEQPSLAGELELRYSISWVLDRLGDRRADLEAEARRRFGWVDELGPQVTRRHDAALIGLRPS
jgi:SAM-dependent methyltransferase